VTDTARIGRATVTRVLETRIELRTSLFSETPAEAWQDDAELLDPTFWDRQTDRWKCAIQTWVVDVDGLTVVVDTGVGNGRDRPYMPPMHQLNTGFLDALGAAGVDHTDVTEIFTGVRHRVGDAAHVVESDRRELIA